MSCFKMVLHFDTLSGNYAVKCRQVFVCFDITISIEVLCVEATIDDSNAFLSIYRANDDQLSPRDIYDQFFVRENISVKKLETMSRIDPGCGIIDDHVISPLAISWPLHMM